MIPPETALSLVYDCVRKPMFFCYAVSDLAPAQLAPLNRTIVMWSQLLRFCVQRAGRIVFAVALLTIVSGYFSYRLYQTLIIDLKELLPRWARSVHDMRLIAKSVS